MTARYNIDAAYGIDLVGYLGKGDSMVDEFVESMYATAHADGTPVNEVIENATGWRDSFLDALKRLGVECPKDAMLHKMKISVPNAFGGYDTYETIVLGFGLFKRPWEWEESFHASAWSEEFRNCSETYMWVTEL